MLLKMKEQLETLINSTNQNIIELNRLKKLEELDVNGIPSEDLDRTIGMNEAAEVMFKKVLEIPDSMILLYFELVTDEHPNAINQIQKRLANGENPQDIKVELAEMITSLYHGELAMFEARSLWEIPSEESQLQQAMPSFLLEIDKEHIHAIIPRLIEMEYIQSENELLRLIREEAVLLNDELLVECDLSIVLMNNDVLQLGKKQSLKFVK